MKSFKSLFLIIAAFIAVFTGAMSSHAEGTDIPVIESIKPDVPVSSGKLEISGKNLLSIDKSEQENAQVILIVKRVVLGKVTGAVTGTVTGEVEGVVKGNVTGEVKGKMEGELQDAKVIAGTVIGDGTVIEQRTFKHNEVELWDESKITLTLPKIIKEYTDDDDVEIQLTICNGKINACSTEKRFWVLPDSIVTDAILLKDRMSEEGISDYLYHRGEQERERNIAEDYTKKNVFGNAKLTSREVLALKVATFDDNFISKMTGERQHINLGVSAIWLYDTKSVVAAPMLRIFLIPKSFYEPRRELIKWRWVADSNSLAKECPINCSFGWTLWNFAKNIPMALLNRTDLNVGSTTSTSTDATTGKNVDKSYYLVGLSFEINPAVLLNLGYAAISGKVDSGIRKQWYLGLTIDENVLRAAKILK
ncbi:MAG: hypothetical protein Q8P28_05490 [Deltaproteobacteria bacterium]|nr:hypothetical protein [Deltaproteobacteria bacterium]